MADWYLFSAMAFLLGCGSSDDTTVRTSKPDRTVDGRVEAATPRVDAQPGPDAIPFIPPKQKLDVTKIFGKTKKAVAKALKPLKPNQLDVPHEVLYEGLDGNAALVVFFTDGKASAVSLTFADAIDVDAVLNWMNAVGRRYEHFSAGDIKVFEE